MREKRVIFPCHICWRTAKVVRESVAWDWPAKAKYATSYCEEHLPAHLRRTDGGEAGR